MNEFLALKGVTEASAIAEEAARVTLAAGLESSVQRRYY